jgi:hypothetical protein
VELPDCHWIGNWVDRRIHLTSILSHLSDKNGSSQLMDTTYQKPISAGTTVGQMPLSKGQLNPSYFLYKYSQATSSSLAPFAIS